MKKNINLQSHGSSHRHFVRSSTEFCDDRCDTRVESHKASVTRLLLSRSVVVAINVCHCAFDCDVCPHRDPLNWLKTSRTFSHARLHITLALGAALSNSAGHL